MQVSGVLGEKKSDLGKLERQLATVDAEIASTQTELDKTFFLNFGKKGELKDTIKGLKKDEKGAWHLTLIHI